MLVDAERVVVEMKALIASKPSHGSRDLLAAIATLEARHRIAEDDWESWVRRLSHHFVDSFMGLLPVNQEDDGPLTDAAASAPAMAGDPHLRSATDSEESCQKKQQPLVAATP